jgi:hypothetical protein
VGENPDLCEESGGGESSKKRNEEKGGEGEGVGCGKNYKGQISKVIFTQKYTCFTKAGNTRL